MQRNSRWNTNLYAGAVLAVLSALSVQAQGGASTPVITVGPNVQVSKQFPKLLHQE